ncbi:outer dense fiber protein 2 isoform X1 [Ambystoma mexicanum]|uniref:outer dense fiber protein 2 isoform X1 n=1 Tax=Ambystoma mexicanum TaxID=8296 RepID=UPI0037E7CB2F
MLKGVGPPRAAEDSTCRSRGWRVDAAFRNRNAATPTKKHKLVRTDPTLQHKRGDMKNRSPTPPLHVHVDESTPVHVYVKKSPKSSLTRVQSRSSISRTRGSSGSQHRAMTVKTKTPWIPPGKTLQPPKTPPAAPRDFKWEEQQSVIKNQDQALPAPDILLRPTGPSGKMPEPRVTNKEKISSSVQSKDSPLSEQQSVMKNRNQGLPAPDILGTPTGPSRKITKTRVLKTDDRSSSARSKDLPQSEQQSVINRDQPLPVPNNLVTTTSLSTKISEMRALNTEDGSGHVRSKDFPPSEQLVMKNQDQALPASNVQVTPTGVSTKLLELRASKTESRPGGVGSKDSALSDQQSVMKRDQSLPAPNNLVTSTGLSTKMSKPRVSNTEDASSSVGSKDSPLSEQTPVMKSQDQPLPTPNNLVTPTVLSKKMSELSSSNTEDKSNSVRTKAPPMSEQQSMSKDQALPAQNNLVTPTGLSTKISKPRASNIEDASSSVGSKAPPMSEQQSMSKDNALLAKNILVTPTGLSTTMSKQRASNTEDASNSIRSKAPPMSEQQSVMKSLDQALPAQNILVTPTGLSTKMSKQGASNTEDTSNSIRSKAPPMSEQQSVMKSLDQALPAQNHLVTPTGLSTKMSKKGASNTEDTSNSIRSKAPPMSEQQSVMKSLDQALPAQNILVTPTGLSAKMSKKGASNTEDASNSIRSKAPPMSDQQPVIKSQDQALPTQNILVTPTGPSRKTSGPRSSNTKDSSNSVRSKDSPASEEPSVIKSQDQTLPTPNSLVTPPGLSSKMSKSRASKTEDRPSNVRSGDSHLSEQQSMMKNQDQALPGQTAVVTPTGLSTKISKLRASNKEDKSNLVGNKASPLAEQQSGIKNQDQAIPAPNILVTPTGLSAKMSEPRASKTEDGSSSVGSKNSLMPEQKSLTKDHPLPTPNNLVTPTGLSRKMSEPRASNTEDKSSSARSKDSHMSEQQSGIKNQDQAIPAPNVLVTPTGLSAKMSEPRALKTEDRSSSDRSQDSLMPEQQSMSKDQPLPTPNNLVTPTGLSTKMSEPRTTNTEDNSSSARSKDSHLSEQSVMKTQDQFFPAPDILGTPTRLSTKVLEPRASNMEDKSSSVRSKGSPMSEQQPVMKNQGPVLPAQNILVTPTELSTKISEQRDSSTENKTSSVKRKDSPVSEQQFGLKNRDQDLPTQNVLVQPSDLSTKMSDLWASKTEDGSSSVRNKDSPSSEQQSIMKNQNQALPTQKVLVTPTGLSTRMSKPRASNTEDGSSSVRSKDATMPEQQSMMKNQEQALPAPDLLVTSTGLSPKRSKPRASNTVDTSSSVKSKDSPMSDQQSVMMNQDQALPASRIFVTPTGLSAKISKLGGSYLDDGSSSVRSKDSPLSDQQSVMKNRDQAVAGPKNLVTPTGLSTKLSRTLNMEDRSSSVRSKDSPESEQQSVMGNQIQAWPSPDTLVTPTSLSINMSKVRVSNTEDTSSGVKSKDSTLSEKQSMKREDQALASLDVWVTRTRLSNILESKFSSVADRPHDSQSTESHPSGTTHRLEITPPVLEKMSSSRSCDLSTDEEAQVRSRMQAYDKKLECLMTEIGSLKTEVESQRKSQCHASSGKCKRQQCNQNEGICPADAENPRLRRSIDRIKEEKSGQCQISTASLAWASDVKCRRRKRDIQFGPVKTRRTEDQNCCSSHIRSGKQQSQPDKDSLLCKLVEAEMDGNAAAKQVSLLKDSMCKMRNEKNVSCADVNKVAQAKEKLLEKLDTFEETNRALRTLLREQQSKEEDSARLAEQKDMLLQKLSCCDAEKTRLQLKLCEREKEMEDILSQLASEKDLAQTATEFTKSLECSKSHLQAAMKKCELENNRLSCQIKELEKNEAQHKDELCKVLKEMQEMQCRADRDKEDLKKATRMQKQRADRCEQSLQQLQCELQGKDAQLEEALACVENWRAKVTQLQCEKTQLEEEITTLSCRVQELIEERQTIEEKARAEKECILQQMHKQAQDHACIKMEYEKLKAHTCAVEEKLNLAQAEVQQLKATVRQYESLVESYKCQVQKTRMEADEICQKLEECDKENKVQKECMNREVEALRRKFKSRIDELEQLPEMLKSTECKLQECQEQLLGYEKKNNELSSMISDLRMRMEQQGDKMESTRERFQSAVEENKQLNMRLEELERKLDEAGSQNRDLVQIVAKREESIHQNQVRLEEKSRDCASLARQLEVAIQDARRQVEQTRERATSKERTTTSKVLDLETQLSRTTTELNQLRRSKEDAERRFQSRLQDMKDRLEQSESTNRSMQNYVQFLKSSYANVFGDTTLSSSPVRPRTPF